MKTLNIYINEAWSGVKKYTNNAEIIAWCEEMGIENYTINSKGEIDVDGDVDLRYRDFEELPYKFGVVKGHFSCRYCKELDSLEGCPTKVGGHFRCSDCKRKFTKEEVQKRCNVKNRIFL